jgi:putative membrane protein
MRYGTWGCTLALLALAACGGNADDQTMAVDTTAMNDSAAMAPGAPAADTMGGTLSDGEIATTLMASDSAEIDPSQLALQQAQDTAVKSFAQTMVDDHGALEDSLRALAQEQSITPAPSSMADQVRTQAQATMQQLQGMNGAAFDTAYVRAMLQSHQSALDAVQNQLTPAAQNPQLKTALQQKVGPTIQMHLDRIRQIASRFGVSQ